MAKEPEAPNRLATTQKDLDTCRTLVKKLPKRTWTPQETQFVLGFLDGVDEILQELALCEEPLSDLSDLMDAVVTVIVPSRDDAAGER